MKTEIWERDEGHKHLWLADGTLHFQTGNSDDVFVKVHGNSYTLDLKDIDSVMYFLSKARPKVALNELEQLITGG